MLGYPLIFNNTRIVSTQNCEFYSNNGALSYISDNSDSSILVVTGSVFMNNWRKDEGGALYIICSHNCAGQ